MKKLFYETLDKDGDAFNLDHFVPGKDIPVAVRSLCVDDEGNLTIRFEYLHGQGD